MRVWIVAAALAVVAGASASWARTQVPDSFPHAEHQGLFPLCAGCHAGIEAGSPVNLYPDPSTCTACHDGQREALVAWSGPTSQPSNLAFSHTVHADRLVESGEVADCTTCHREADAEVRMAVSGARSETCLTCHEAPQHLAAVNDCATCHTPIWEATELSVARVEAFPQPPDHASPNFLLEHGALDRPREFEALTGATCATCHARESCERCHANGEAVASIASLGRDERIASIVRSRAAEYPVPAEHQTLDWAWNHAVTGDAEVRYCANCHTQPSCTTCHVEQMNAQVAALPLPRPGGPVGVPVDDGERRVHRDDFVVTHRSQAAALEPSCLGCHVQETCVSCHAGPASPVFHETNFLEVHASAAYRDQTDCVSCHTPEVFCRACHQGAGLASGGSIDTAFHNRNPAWLFGHGAPARVGLQGCVTCHSQSDCTQCHSAVGGWGINPHGPGFDPARAADANRSGCVICHRPGGV